MPTDKAEAIKARFSGPRLQAFRLWEAAIRERGAAISLARRAEVAAQRAAKAAHAAEAAMDAVIAASAVSGDLEAPSEEPLARAGNGQPEVPTGAPVAGEVVSVQEAAKMGGVTAAAVHYWRVAQGLPGTQDSRGRFWHTRDDVVEFLRLREEKAKKRGK